MPRGRRDAADTDADPLTLRVVATRWEADGIVGIDLADPEGANLPPFAAGAHIEIDCGAAGPRQYSLCADPAGRKRYRIAVLLEADGRGGSRWVHETLRAGAMVRVSPPRNLFPLAAGAGRHLLLAGGIGVTPMMAMVHELEAAGADYTLHYCTRDLARTAFLDALAPMIAAGRVHLHLDGGEPTRGLDIAGLLAAPAPDTHLYYCGPPGFMAAAKAAAAHWPRERVHFEYFQNPDDGAGADPAADTPFKVEIKDTGEVFDVPAGLSIVEVLRDNGIAVDTQCEDGFCGTCLTRYVAGEPEHRDQVLDDDDRARFVLICKARSKTPTLVLDI